MPTPTDAARRADIARYLTIMEQGARDATIEDCKWLVRFTAQPGNTAVEIEREVAANRIADLAAALTAARAENERLTKEREQLRVALDPMMTGATPVLEGTMFGTVMGVSRGIWHVAMKALDDYFYPPTAADADGTPPQRDPAGEGESE